MANSLEEFRRFRERMNERILEAGNLEIKRFFALDTRCYEAGALDVKTRSPFGSSAGVSGQCTPSSDAINDIDFVRGSYFTMPLCVTSVM